MWNPSPRQGGIPVPPENDRSLTTPAVPGVSDRRRTQPDGDADSPEGRLQDTGCSGRGRSPARSSVSVGRRAGNSAVGRSRRVDAKDHRELVAVDEDSTRPGLAPRESNPDHELQRLGCCRYTRGQYSGPVYLSSGYPLAAGHACLTPCVKGRPRSANCRGTSSDTDLNRIRRQRRPLKPPVIPGS